MNPVAGNADAAATEGEGQFLEGVIAADDLAGGFGAVGGDESGKAGVGSVVEAADNVARGEEVGRGVRVSGGGGSKERWNEEGEGKNDWKGGNLHPL